MALIDYPSSLPRPQASIVTPAERRQLVSEQRPLYARNIERDRREFEQLTWPPMNAVQMAIWREWYNDDLVLGGAWFNATWPLPRGFVSAVRKFLKPPSRSYLGRGFWRVTATCEVRGRTLEVGDVGPPASLSIGWFNPVTNALGTVAHANSGTGELSSSVESPVTNLFAGMVGWIDEVLVWSIASWTSSGDHPSPTIVDAANEWVQIDWINTDGISFPIYDPSLGTLVLTATINGNAIATGQRLLAIATPPTGDYPTIAWGPE